MAEQDHDGERKGKKQDCHSMILSGHELHQPQISLEALHTIASQAGDKPLEHGPWEELFKPQQHLYTCEGGYLHTHFPLTAHFLLPRYIPRTRLAVSHSNFILLILFFSAKWLW